MNILLIQDDCSVGGHTYLRMENAAGLRRRGHHVVAFFFNDLGGAERFSRVCPVVIGGAADLRRTMLANSIDVVHGDASMIDLPRYLQAAGFLGRLVLTRHAVDSPVGWLRGDCDAYVAESRSSAALMQPYTDLNVEIVPNGIDVDFFRPVDCVAPRRPIIAWCGRSGAAFKNVRQYLEVAGVLNASTLARIIHEPQIFPSTGDIEGTKLVTREFNGRVNRASPFRIRRDDAPSVGTAIAEPLALGSGYEFRVADGDAGRPEDFNVDPSLIASWRRYDRDEFPRFYSEIASSGGCLLVTSHHEGLPLTLLEALACGCPVIARCARGVDDVLSGAMSRWLFPADYNNDEVAAFVQARLADAAREPDLRNRLRRHIVDNFAVDVMVEGNLRCYRGLAGGAPPTGLDERDRRQSIAINLWEHAGEALDAGGRPRDALFAMRAAARLDPVSLLSGGRLPRLVSTWNSSRLAGARHFAECARRSFAERHIAAGVGEAVRALRTHPGVMFAAR